MTSVFRTTLVVFALSLSGGRPDAARRRPIETINPVIGDLSFRTAFGREPTGADDEVLRVRTHLAYVERRLREADVGAQPPTLRAERARNLDRLRDYWIAERFPAADTADGRLPTFIDDEGRRCAVAYLLEQSAGAEAALRVGRGFRNAYVAEIDDAALAAWVAGSGLTRDELAIVQPTYHERPRPLSTFSSELGAQYLRGVAGARPDGLTSLADLDGAVRWTEGPPGVLNGHWMAELSGAVGRVPSGNVLYDVDLGLGVVRYPVMFARRFGLSLGPGLDGITGVVPAGLTVGAAALWNLNLIGGRWRRPGLRFGLRGRGERVVAGRAHEYLWQGDADLTWFNAGVWGRSAIDFVLSGSARRYAETTYAGVTVGLRYGFVVYDPDVYLGGQYD